MLAARNVLKILLVAVAASVALVACSGAGGSGERSAGWFNLPSIPLDVAANGSTSVLGFPVNGILQPSLVQQMQGAGIQRAEVRVGADGIYLFDNGETLPYVDWSEQSLDTVQRLLNTEPVRNALRQQGVSEGQIAAALPWLQRIGLGVALNIAPAEGQALDTPAWDGRVLQPAEAAPAEGGAPGPITINSLAFNDSGEASFGSIPLSQIDPSLGSALTLDENTRSLINAIGAESVRVNTGPTGINLALGDQPLPGIAYDAASLERALALVPALGLVDPALNDTLQQLGPRLATTQLDLGVSFTGEPLGETDLSDLTVNLNDDGSLSALGFPVGGAGTVDAQLLSTLQKAGVQQLRIDLANDGLSLLANGEPLPRITWTPESLGTLAQIVAPLAGVAPETITSAVAVASESNVGATVNLPGSEGSAAPAGEITFAAPDLGALSAPVLRIDAAYSGSEIQSLGPIAGADLAEAGVASSLSLPANVVQALQAAGAQAVQITSAPNVINLLIDGSNALSIEHDAASLTNAFNLALPFLNIDALNDPAVQKLLTEQILPLVPAADLDVKVNLQ